MDDKLNPSGLNEEAQKAVEYRIAASESEREKTRRCIAEGNPLEADTVDRVEKRKHLLLSQSDAMPGLTESIRAELSGATLGAVPADARVMFEAQIGGLDWVPGWFLTRGAEVRRTVGRIHIRRGGARGWGTGFLVGRRLLVTNQHVLDSLATAQSSFVEFDFEETYEGNNLPSARFNIRPDILFISSPQISGLDYALVAVEGTERDGSRLLDEFKHNVLRREEGKVLVGELVHAIHHPEGQSRQLSIHSGRLVAISDPALDATWLHYETDTKTGSSGAPLFNAQWQVVGIHHGGVVKKDAQGRELAVGGKLWTSGMGIDNKWVHANEGLRVSKFVADVEAQIEGRPPGAVITPEGLTLLADLLNPGDAGPGAAVPPQIQSPPQTRPERKQPVFRPE